MRGGRADAVQGASSVRLSITKGRSAVRVECHGANKATFLLWRAAHSQNTGRCLACSMQYQVAPTLPVETELARSRADFACGRLPPSPPPPSARRCRCCSPERPAALPARNSPPLKPEITPGQRACNDLSRPASTRSWALAPAPLQWFFCSRFPLHVSHTCRRSLPSVWTRPHDTPPVSSARGNPAQQPNNPLLSRLPGSLIKRRTSPR